MRRSSPFFSFSSPPPPAAVHRAGMKAPRRAAISRCRRRWPPPTPSPIRPLPPPPSSAPRPAPNIGPTAAPGVAFNYRYAFRLAAPRIAEVQEQHALMCERLTVARCRITGLRYRVVNDRDIEAMLALKLDPSVARHFGREGVQTVTAAEGMLDRKRDHRHRRRQQHPPRGPDSRRAERRASPDRGAARPARPARRGALPARLRGPAAAPADPRGRSGPRGAAGIRSPPRRWCSTTARATSSPASTTDHLRARPGTAPGAMSPRPCSLVRRAGDSGPRGSCSACSAGGPRSASAAAGSPRRRRPPKSPPPPDLRQQQIWHRHKSDAKLSTDLVE